MNIAVLILLLYVSVSLEGLIKARLALYYSTETESRSIKTALDCSVLVCMLGTKYIIVLPYKWSGQGGGGPWRPG
jgi:hypothetical protein